MHGEPPRQAKHCVKCRADRRRRAQVKYTWRSEYDAYLKAYYFGRLNSRIRVPLLTVPRALNSPQCLQT
jgi:hypothetical protein